ncbi:MAG: division/cell wall cluster transcriptional repressor MraZ [Caldisericia bacterium]|nr:division/cell wall cluster transcriptional repressor MraZ [Caldisericia bacterium]
MFMGTYLYKMDSKGRVMVPPIYREELGTKFVVTKGLEKCLFGYPTKEWENLSKKLAKISLTTKETRFFLRVWFSSATFVEIDNQGRILIPLEFRKFASLKRDVAFIGVFNRVEIWDKNAWDKYLETKELSYENSVSKLVENI